MSIMLYMYFYCILPIVGVGTKIDPTLCRADRLVGQVLGAVGALPDIFTELEISYFLLRRLLGVRTEGDKKGARVGRQAHLLYKVYMHVMYMYVYACMLYGIFERWNHMQLCFMYMS